MSLRWARVRSVRWWAVVAVAAVVGSTHAPPAVAAESRPGLAACWLPGVEHEAWCGSVRRPLDPARPQGVQIDVHYAVLPALARNRKRDPVFFFAGGPGQSAIALAGSVSRLLARASNRRDIVLVDQRGTGRSAPLRCQPQERPTAPLAESADADRALAHLRACRAALQKLPHGDLRHYTTWVAVQDVDAVRLALGAARIDIVGGSYGTRAALDYLRQFPHAVRRAVIDGVAPPDMALPAGFSADNQAALDAVWQACESDARCQQRHPGLRERWHALLASLPRPVRVAHPITGDIETLAVTRLLVLQLTLAPLYSPALAAGLPAAIEAAADGRFEPLVGLASALNGGGGDLGKIAEGMHFSVVCSEDVPRMRADELRGADFGDLWAVEYGRICDGWPRGEVPPAFYTLPPARAATLVLSGGADPVTPPRHGERVAQALGPLARHVVVANAGHGVMSLGCLRDVVFRFIDAETDADALSVDANCASRVPRPAAFVAPAEPPRP